MENLYLNIEKLGDDKIHIFAYDGVFVYSAPCISKENFQKYCDEKANMWLNSTLDNFHYWSKQKRKSIAHKWTIAKNLSKGKYNYYFNSGNKEDAFREEVAYLAESMDIKNYTLTIE